jgi:hypothetical protein
MTRTEQLKVRRRMRRRIRAAVAERRLDRAHALVTPAVAEPAETPEPAA